MLASVVGLRWIVDGDSCKHATVAYAVALAAAAIASLFRQCARRTYFTVHCDAISIGQVGDAC